MATLPARCRSGAFIWEKWWRVFWASLLWLAFLCSLTARGLSGVELVTSDAHQGLKNAIAAVFTGASWQRCRTHFMANLLTRVPKRAQPGVATMVRTIYQCHQQLSPAEVHGQLDRVVEQLREPFPQVAEWRTPRRTSWPARLPSGPLAEAVVQQPTGTAEPRDPSPQSLPPKGDVVGIFPNRLWARCWPSNTTNGPKPAATSPSPTPSATRYCRSPICWTQRPDQHQRG